MSHPPRPNQRPKYPPSSTREEQLTMQQGANPQREIDEWAKREGTRHEQEEQRGEKETGDVRRNEAKEAGVQERRERSPGFEGGQARLRYVMETHTREAELKRQREERGRQKEVRGRQGGAGVRYPWPANSSILAQASTTRGDLSMESMIQIYQRHDRQWSTSLDRNELHWDHFPWPMFTQPGAPNDITEGAILAYQIELLPRGRQLRGSEGSD
ncbi:hypothetical protein P691DRAFT_422521 [Macrolepiota fuliginosa MF-IS2]|uniref:Uncharacterized protein n=1 Tax=Macrolepiota fuliginosa MF-IS2 TaxID=1400762 RepID=A0A9P5X4V5_9AGAR|nr:hypothetical protein P691DRAFT_422521 [Macrolepiota fuliginosa MF-IS2]